MKYFEKPLSQQRHLIQLKSNPGFRFPFAVQASWCSAQPHRRYFGGEKVVDYLNDERQNLMSTKQMRACRLTNADYCSRMGIETAHTKYLFVPVHGSSSCNEV